MKLTVLFLSAMMAAGSAFCADGKDKSWYETTLKGLKSKIAQKYQSTSVGASSVAAVRGAKVSDDSSKPYWKGTQSDKSGKKMAAQRKQFAAALEFAVSGKDAEASAALEKFIKDNPESPYLADAKEALKRVNAKPEAEAKPDAPAQPQAAASAVPAPPAPPVPPVPPVPADKPAEKPAVPAEGGK
ncbi:MAG: hypothetical protein WC421_00025 [Elusimicrobiales bacterium]